MSFVLRFFHAPHATSVREAVDWADGRRAAEPITRNPRFARFVESITEFYPNVADDDDDIHNLWPEYLESDDRDGAVVNVLINTDMFDEGVMSVIAQHADAAGLQVLDEQNGLLYGPGPRVIGLHDETPQALPEVSRYAYSVMTENIRGLRFDHAQRQIADALQAALGRGFEVVEGPSAAVVRRDHGDLRQMLSLQVMRSTDRANARVYAQLGFACAGRAREWLALLPEAFAKRRSNYDASAGGTAMEFAAFVPDLTQGTLPASLSLGTDSRMRFADASQLASLLEGVRAWSIDALLPFLDRVRTEDDLLPLFIHDAALRHARTGRMAFPVYPAMLTLARRVSPQALDDYANAYRANADFARLCTLFKDPEGMHFDALVEGLHRQALAD